MVENGKETIVNIDDEIPFDIPESWAWCRLGNVCNYINAGGDKPNNFSKKITRENNIPIYSNGLDNEGLYGYTNSPSIIDPAITISARGTIGVPFIRTTPFVHIIRLIAVVPLSHIDISYLYYVLSTRRLVSEGSSIPQLTVPSVLPYLFPLPPIEEQKRIVEAIENLTNKISSIDEEYSSIEEKISLTKSKLLDLAIRGKLLPQDKNDEPASELLKHIREEKESAQLTSKGKRKTAESYIFKGEDNLYYEKIVGNGKETITNINDDIPYNIPSNWSWTKFEDVAEISRGGSPRPITSFITDSTNGVNWIKIGDAEKGGKYIYTTKEKIKKEGIRHSKYVESGDFLLSNSMSFGRPYILKTDGCIHDGWLSIKFNKNVLNEDFLYNLLSSKFMYFQFESLAVGSTVKNLKSDSVKIAKIPIPPINEQKRISNFLDKVFEQLDSLIQH